MQADQAIALCDFELRMHPISYRILESYLGGGLSQAEFLRFFSLPNSDYIALARCFVDLMVVWI